MNTQHTQLQKLEIQFQHEIQRATKVLEFLHTHRDKLQKLELTFSGYGDYVDFDNLQRPKLMAVLRTFGGKWDKNPSCSGGVTYTRRDDLGGLTLRCYNGEPPPSCRIVESVKYVQVPATTERVVTRTVVCK